MNEYLQYYLVFAIGTAIVGMIQIFNPLMQTLREVRPYHNMNDYSIVSYITFFFIMFVAAPLVFIVTVIPSMGERFKNSMLEAVLNEEAA